MMETQFDLVVIGGGPAGYVASIRAAQLGLKTACIEMRKTLGGTCLNVGCIPSKALLDSSEHFYQAKTKFQKHGILVGDLKLDLEQMMKRKDAVVRQLTTGIAGLFKKNGVTFVNGKGQLAGAEGPFKKIVVQTPEGSQTLLAKKVLLATGSEPIELPFLKFDGKQVVSSTEALEFSKVPQHLVVVGGGVIGLEMGSVWARLGSKVTVVEFNDWIAGGADRQASSELMKSLSKQGIEFKLGHKCLGASKKGDWLLVEIEDRKSGSKFTLEADKVLVSTGRRPYSDGLGLESLGIEKDAQGRVPVNDHFETAAEGVYAVGDLIVGAMLAHKAEEEGIAAVEFMAGQHGHVNYQAIPNVIYTHPELASVGWTEEEVKERNVPYRVGSFPYMANGRAKAMEEAEGIVKIIAHAENDRVLGIHIVGARAGDLIAEGVAMLEFGATAQDIAQSSHAHPTLSEVMKEAALAVHRRQIHL
ncbi:MAG: dihydrolipoyl dehydrogenase [Pseudomonadota bacterium]|jgi:dihydrolipoamide dehydrogenase